MHHRVPILLAWVTGVLLSACGPGEGPDSVVRRFDDLARKRSWDEALALVDLDAKAARMLGDLYAAAPEEDRLKTRELFGRRLRANTESAYGARFKEGPGEIKVTSLEESRAEVTQKEGDFVLVYELEKRREGWIIIDRTHEKDGVRPKVEQGMSMVLKRIEGELGRPPRLADVNERLEFYLERMRERVFRIGAPLPATGSGAGRANGAATHPEDKMGAATGSGAGRANGAATPPEDEMGAATGSGARKANGAATPPEVKK